MSNHKDIIDINISGVHTNIMFVELVKDGLNAAQLNARLSHVSLRFLFPALVPFLTWSLVCQKRPSNGFTNSQNYVFFMGK